MFNRMTWLCGLCVVLVLAGACDQGQRNADGMTATQDSAKSQPDARYTAGWQQLRERMDPVEVLQLIGEPVNVKVTAVNTHWYYSGKAADGPHVVFDTRSMRVERWRAPKS